MLTEPDVINYVCVALQQLGYNIHKKNVNVRQKGDDIIAIKQLASIRKLYIKAKGETSSDPNSNRYGQSFDNAQVRVHIGQALYKIAEVLSRKPLCNVEIRAGIALPNTCYHQYIISKVKPTIDYLEIPIFWVDSTGNVQISSIWKV